MKKVKKALKIEKFEVARFENTFKIKGGDDTNGGHTIMNTSRQCRDAE